MTVTEFVTFQLKEAGDPRKNQHFMSLITSLSSRQLAWSGFPVVVLTDAVEGETSVASKQAIIHLVSGWTSIEAHQEWMTSEKNHDLLLGLGPLVDMKQLVHLDSGFDSIKNFLEQAQDRTVMIRGTDAPSTEAVGGWTLDGDKKAFIKFDIADKQEGPEDYAVRLHIGE
ncbi:hypothetical protein FRC03_009447 [Tulasnella sp. 419]|nr:hypothetical protein FRC03_009447 [Tulasnella sp. 419]